MKNAKNLFYNGIIIGLSILCALVFVFSNKIVAKAEPEIIYSDDLYIGDEDLVDASYYVNCDSVILLENVSHISAPSFGNIDSTKPNGCGPITGMNVVGFYDRWCTELIAGYDPGMVFANGNYHYYPDRRSATTINAFSKLYSLMKTDEVGGTTSTNFKNGLNFYIYDAGYNVSYESFYSSKTSINFNKLKNAIDNNKVGVVMCSEYNFISSIIFSSSEGRAHIAQSNSTIPHMMMVYGYQVYGYYSNGQLIQTDTVLNVTNSKSIGAVGYMKLNDFSVINEALIISIY